MTTLEALHAAGCDAWIDDLTRAWLEDGTLERLITVDGISGVTSNPAIFERSLRSDAAYAAGLGAAREARLTAEETYESLVCADLQRASELLLPVHARSRGRDGFVSWEVSPHHAHSAERTIDEARRLFRRLDRINGMIKVPATAAGVTAVRALVAEGIPVNVTLLFGLRRYAQIVGAIMAGFEDRLRRRLPLDVPRVVTSVFLSRIDAAADRAIAGSGAEAQTELRGEAAYATAIRLYLASRDWLESMRWRRLADAGAVAPRLLWASTATKDPAYDPLKYVDPVAWPGTINTLTPATLAAWRQRAEPFRPPPPPDGGRSDRVWAALEALGLSLESLAEALEAQGVRLFCEAHDRSIASVATRLHDPHPQPGARR